MRHTGYSAPLAFALALLPSMGMAQAAQRPAPPMQVAHSRLLPLEGGQNFRDLGGYRTADGRRVKWGLLYRSGAMNGLTRRDFATLQTRGIRTVCDFRTTGERRSAPVAWPDTARPAIFTEDYELDRDFGALMRPGLTGPQAVAAMTAFYRQMPFRFAGQYRRMFAELVAGRAPLAFNCSAGKDRTGVAAALLLTALGASYATVKEDYLLSNRYFDPRRTASGPADGDRTASFVKTLSPDALKALMGVDPRYLDAAFAEIKARPGGMKRYFRETLGVSAPELRTLRTLYLQPG